MQSVLKALTRQPPADPLLYIVVAQYQRYSYGLGQENRYHWAVAVLSDLEKSAKEQCRCYQVSNDIVPTPVAHVEWRILVNRSAVLGQSGKYRGGVVVGRVRKSELEDLDHILSHHEPVVKYDGWNCHSWVLEGIQLMAAKGWITTEITSRDRLFPTLKAVNAAALEALKNNLPVMIFELDQGVPMQGDHQNTSTSLGVL